MNLLRLRDHSQSCEHAPHGAVHVDFKEGHVVIDDAGFDSWCPGGREVVLRRMSWTEWGESVIAAVYVEVTDDA